MQGNQFATLDSSDFPNLLRELHVSNNCSTNLDGATFPDLEVLDISSYTGGGIKSMKDFRLPCTLKILKANGH